MKNVRLVLGSGGARGMAHIGVIDALEAQGYTIVEVAGCSMGAVVGGIYCTGHLAAYKKWLTRLTKMDVFKLLDFAFSSQGFVKGERVFKAMETLMGDHQIEHMPIPFTAVAADVINKREVHYRSGSLFKALRASIAMPTIFTPVIEGQGQLVDGGVLNPLPLNVVHPEPGDLIVAVNINANIPIRNDRAIPVENKEKAAYQKMLDAFRAQVWKVDTKAEAKVEMFGFFDLLTKSFEMTQDRLTELMIHQHQPHMVVNISRDACGVFEFYRALEMIDEGARAFDVAHKAHLEQNSDASTEKVRILTQGLSNDPPAATA